MARLVYTDGLGRTVEASGCMEDRGVPLPLIRSRAECPAHHQFDVMGSKGRSTYAVSGWAGPDSGELRQVAACAPAADADKVALARHELSECDSYRAPNGRSYRQIRIDLITPDDPLLGRAGRHTLIGCHPAPALNDGLQSAPGPCSARLFHDEVTHTSFFGRRILAIGAKGEATAITDCIPDPERWVAQQLGVDHWENDDRHLAARAWVRWVVPNADGTVREAVGAPFRQDGMTPYVAEASQIRPGGEARLMCARWRLQDEWTVWRRPDGTRVSLFSRPGPSLRLDRCSPGAGLEAAEAEQGLP
jgi:hypothetical protein